MWDTLEKENWIQRVRTMMKIQVRIFGRALPPNCVNCSFRSTRSNIRGDWRPDMSRLLRTMREILARQEGPTRAKTERNLTPATATSYFLTVLIPQYRGKMNLRTSRELRTLCKALDLLASGNPESQDNG